jgi:arsenite methyltransferase
LIAEPNDLTSALALVGDTFAIDELLASHPSPGDIAPYYHQSLVLYLLLHSPAGALHFALDGDDFSAQARIIVRHLDPLRVRNVLEIASGVGYNAVRLARRLPGVHVTGLDLIPLHVRLARLRACRLARVKFEHGDFHRLPFARHRFDGVCAVEGFCHAHHLDVALSEVARVLRPGGRFVTVDGFLLAPPKSLAQSARTAIRLIDSAFAVSRTWTLEDLLATADSLGLRAVAVEDLTSRVLYNVERISRMARFCLRRRRRARAFAHVLPRSVIRNEVAGALLPHAIRSGAYGYHAVVLERGVEAPAPWRRDER